MHADPIDMHVARAALVWVRGEGRVEGKGAENKLFLLRDWVCDTQLGGAL